MTERLIMKDYWRDYNYQDQDNDEDNDEDNDVCQLGNDHQRAEIKE